MRKTVIPLLMCLLLLPCAAMAAAPVQGPYVSGFIGASIPSGSDTTSTDFVTGNSFSDRVKFDPGINLGGTGGYDFGMVRLEGELSYKYSEMKSITNRITGARLQNVDGNLGVLAFMANGFFDFHNNTPVTPYIGGGIGFASLQLSDTFSRNVLVYGESDDLVFAWQAGGGVEVALNRLLSLDLGYRYFATERADFESNRAIDTRMKFQSHNATVGVRFKF